MNSIQHSGMLGAPGTPAGSKFPSRTQASIPLRQKKKMCTREAEAGGRASPCSYPSLAHLLPTQGAAVSHLSEGAVPGA